VGRLTVHEVREAERDGVPVRELVSPEGLVASYAPGAGMVCASLRSHGAELLGQRKGLRVYAETGSTMGIPLLHPWANRLGRMGYRLGDVDVAFPADSPLIHDDGQGLPIHGLLGGCPDWQVETFEADAGAAHLGARLDFAAQPDLMALFPFAHELRIEVTLCGPALAVRTELRATGDRAVPVAFGYHPYFRLPDVPRAAWELTLPVRRHAVLDSRCLPTGQTEAAKIEPGPLGDTIYDDLYTELDPSPTFVLAGGGRRVEVSFGEGYGVGVIYAPANDDVVCFEPMTAPTNPFEGGSVRRVEPGESFEAGFEVRVG
jgi:galactose mutarotase-like enzyme